MYSREFSLVHLSRYIVVITKDVLLRKQSMASHAHLMEHPRYDTTAVCISLHRYVIYRNKGSFEYNEFSGEQCSAHSSTKVQDVVGLSITKLCWMSGKLIRPHILLTWSILDPKRCIISQFLNPTHFARGELFGCLRPDKLACLVVRDNSKLLSKH